MKSEFLNTTKDSPVLWCSWMHRWLIFRRHVGSLYIFEDFGDAQFLLTEEDVDKLTTSPDA